MKKDRFMQQLNHSYGQEGSLTCSFNDYQLCEFIQQKRRAAGKLPKGYAVMKVGQQEDGSWVFGEDIYLHENGTQMDASESKYVWISHLYTGPGIAPQDSSCSIDLPLCTDPLTSLILHMRDMLKHNFYPGLLVMGSSAMALHYQTIISQFFFCPIPLAFGIACGTGKTTALRCGLSIVGAHPARFYSKESGEKYSEISSQSNLPFAIDDPKSQAAISDLSIALFNGAKATTLKRGDSKPLSMPIISANFTTSDKVK